MCATANEINQIYKTKYRLKKEYMVHNLDWMYFCKAFFYDSKLLEILVLDLGLGPTSDSRPWNTFITLQP